MIKRGFKLGLTIAIAYETFEIVHAFCTVGARRLLKKLQAMNDKLSEEKKENEGDETEENGGFSGREWSAFECDYDDTADTAGAGK